MEENKSLELMPMELQIVDQIILEKTNKEIAHNLNYSVRMIEIFISKLFVKFNVRSRIGLVVKCISYGVARVPDIYKDTQLKSKVVLS